MILGTAICIHFLDAISLVFAYIRLVNFSTTTLSETLGTRLIQRMKINASFKEFPLVKSTFHF